MQQGKVKGEYERGEGLDGCMIQEGTLQSRSSPFYTLRLLSDEDGM
jgi:hypothetical protein